MGRVLNILVRDESGDIARVTKGMDSTQFQIRDWQADSRDDLLGKPVWDAVIIATDNPDQIEQDTRAIRASACGDIPVLALAEFNPLPHGADGWLRSPALASQIAARLRTLSRLRTMEDIVVRRRAAAQVFGVKFNEDERDTFGRPCVLFVGDATPRFMNLRHALADGDADVIAAFSSYSAFDYLHERPFDAVVLNAMKSRDVAFTISSAMRRNTRLYHTPVLLLAHAGLKDDADEAFARGVSDLLPENAADDEIRGRILLLAEERRRRRRAKAEFEACRTPKTLDDDTGLFKQGFALAHLQDLLNAAHKTERITGLVLMHLGAPDDTQSDTSVRAARRQFASMLRHLLRAEDCPASLGPDLFAAILPTTDRDGAKCVAERVVAIADCTAFEGDDPLKPFRLTVQTVAIEAHGDETAEAVIERAQRHMELPKAKVI